MFRETFIHPSLVAVLVDAEGNYPIIDNSFGIAYNEANQLVSNLPLEFKFIFDVDVFTLKRAMVYIYNYILQNKAVLTNLDVKGLSIKDGDIFAHFKMLRDEEMSDLDSMRKELAVYMTSDNIRTNSNEGRQSQGGRLKFGVMKNNYTGRYY